MRNHHTVESKKRPINLTIRADVLEEAKRLDLDASQAAEAGIVATVKAARERDWLEENEAAIAAYNERVDREGLLIRPYWAQR